MCGSGTRVRILPRETMRAVSFPIYDWTDLSTLKAESRVERARRVSAACGDEERECRVGRSGVVLGAHGISELSN